MKFHVGFQTDIGRRRKVNQDAGSADLKQGVFVVADGMGGHQGGEIASSIVAQELPTALIALRASGVPASRTLLETGLKTVNRRIFEQGLKEIHLKGMGTTACALTFTPTHAFLGSVGDSRIYFVRPGQIWQITRDHSLVAEKVRSGIITREKAKADTQRNVITRCIGFEPDVMIDTYEYPIQQGDCFVMCSDGLHGLVEDREILEIIMDRVFQQNQHQEAAKALVSLANENGGDDNITVLVVQVDSLE
jgi:serine/threonine protein phosphatase PrpC